MDDNVVDRIATEIADLGPVRWDSGVRQADEVQQALLDELRLIAELSRVQEDANRTDLVEAGTRWAHLILMDRLGHGTYGDVYRALDTRLDREVALKLLPCVADLEET